MPKFRRRPEPSSEPVIEAIQYKQMYCATEGISVNAGVWLVQYEDGSQIHISDNEFQRTFEQIGE